MTTTTSNDESKVIARTLMHSVLDILGRNPQTTAPAPRTTTHEITLVLDRLNLDLDDAVTLLRNWGKQQRELTQLPQAFEVAWALEETFAPRGMF